MYLLNELTLLSATFYQLVLAVSFFHPLILTIFVTFYLNCTLLGNIYLSLASLSYLAISVLSLSIRQFTFNAIIIIVINTVWFKSISLLLDFYLPHLFFFFFYFRWIEDFILMIFFYPHYGLISSTLIFNFLLNVLEIIIYIYNLSRSIFGYYLPSHML